MEMMSVPTLPDSAVMVDVYEPAEDTYLFLDGLLAEREFFNTELRPTLALEIGSGSGAVLTAFAQQLEAANQTCMLFATDLNPRACHATKSTIHLNAIGAPFDMIRMNLLSAIHARHQFDVILMNPPYVVTESEDVSPGVLTSDNDKESCIAAAWAGGRDGREVVDQILGPLLASYLSPRGVMYLITIEENKPHEIARRMAEVGFHMETIGKKKAWNERLALQKFTRVSTPGASRESYVNS